MLQQSHRLRAGRGTTARSPRTLRIPLCVLRNHDYESNAVSEGASRRSSASSSSTTVETSEYGVRRRGTAGGFGRGVLRALGRGRGEAVRQRGPNEALKLETALARLRTPSKIPPHYAPGRRRAARDFLPRGAAGSKSRYRPVFMGTPTTAHKSKTLRQSSPFSTCHYIDSGIPEMPLRVLDLTGGEAA